MTDVVGVWMFSGGEIEKKDESVSSIVFPTTIMGRTVRFAFPLLCGCLVQFCVACGCFAYFLLEMFPQLTLLRCVISQSAQATSVAPPISLRRAYFVLRTEIF